MHSVIFIVGLILDIVCSASSIRQCICDCLYVCPYMSMSLSLSVCRYLSLYVSGCVCVSVYHTVSSVSVSVCLCLSLFLYLSPFHSKLKSHLFNLSYPDPSDHS